MKETPVCLGSMENDVKSPVTTETVWALVRTSIHSLTAFSSGLFFIYVFYLSFFLLLLETAAYNNVPKQWAKDAKKLLRVAKLGNKLFIPTLQVTWWMQIQVI